MRSRCKTQRRGLDHELSDEPCEIGACETPVKWRRHALVILLEAQQAILDLRETGKIVGSECLALHDGEIDLDLVEPTGVYRP